MKHLVTHGCQFLGQRQEISGFPGLAGILWPDVLK
jgi:hypothetical protein